MIEFEYKGKKYEADAEAAKNYAVIRGLMLASEDLHGFFFAMNKLFAGKDIEYSETLEGGIDEMGQLVACALEASGQKNS